MLSNISCLLIAKKRKGGTKTEGTVKLIPH